MANQPPLRVGLLLNSHRLYLWEYAMLERVASSDYASIELVVYNDRPTEPLSLWQKLLRYRKQLVYGAYRKLDRWLFPAKDDAFTVLDARDVWAGAEEIRVVPRSSKFSDRFSPEDLERIHAAKLDVLVRLGFNILRGDILHAAKHGVWSYHHGDNRVNRGGPAGFWEVMEQVPTTGSILQILSEDLDAGQVLSRSYSQTDKRSVHRNRNKMFWKTLSLLPRKLEELHRDGEEAFFARVKRENRGLEFYSQRLYSASKLSNWKMLRLWGGLAARYVREKLAHQWYFEQWQLFTSHKRTGDEGGPAPSLWRYRRITPPKDRFFADPCVVTANGQHYVFLEELPYRAKKGHISVATLDENGKLGTPQQVIERPYHLSYPFVFQHEGSWYLIPESASASTVELYRAREFPWKWEFVRNLMERVSAYDVTLHQQEGRWWMFANIVENPAAPSYDELFLFSADDPLHGPWVPHPRNPIVSDVRCARPAGRLFFHQSKLLRPAQDCSTRYGYATRLREVTLLTMEEYEEQPFEAIEPHWQPDVVGTHTLTHAAGMTVVDALVRRRRSTSWRLARVLIPRQTAVHRIAVGRRLLQCMSGEQRKGRLPEC